MIDSFELELISPTEGVLPSISYDYNKVIKAGFENIPETLPYHCNLGRHIRITCKKVGDVFKINILGSLHKYYHGNNYVSFSHKEIKDALKKLAIELKLDLLKGFLKRIDIGYNIEVNRTPAMYNVLFQNGYRFTKKIIGTYETVSFEKKRIALVFYNKYEEMRAHRDPHLASNKVEKNVLRYELKVRKLLAKALKLENKHLYVSDLNSRRIYKRLVRLWYREYRLIFKKHKKSSSLDYSKFQYYLIAEGVQKLGGFNRSLVVLNDWCHHYNFSRQKKSYLKNSIKEILTVKKSKHSLISELDTKIKTIKNSELGILSSI